MKKKFIFLAMMLLTFLGVNVLNAQETTITIGSQGSAVADMPLRGLSNYSMTQQIYTVDEIMAAGGSAGTIDGISFNNIGTYTYQIEVYLKHVDIATFSNTTTLQLESGDLVYSGDFTFSGGFCKISFQNAFEYNGTSNLLVCVNATSNGTNMQFYKYNKSSGALRCNHASLAFEPTEYTVTANYKQNYTNYIQLHFSSMGAPALAIEVSEPQSVFVGDATSLEATASGGSGEYTYSWSLNEEIVGTEATYTFTPSATGEYNFTCTVKDSEGETATAFTTVTVAERPALALTLEGDTDIYSDETTTLYAKAQYGSGSYTSYSWTMNGEPIEFTGTEYTFAPSTIGEYNFSCTVTDSEGKTATASTTVTVTERPENPIDPEKQYRIKALSYNTKDNNNVYAGPYNFSNDMYLHITSNTTADGTWVQVLPYQKTVNQVFSFEPTGTENVYYLRSADGYYIHCYQWNVGAYSTGLTSASQIGVSFVDNTQTSFYLMNGTLYFKAEESGSEYKVYCDFDQKDMTATWALEEVLPEAPDAPTVYANAISATAVQLSWDAVFGADTYTVYEGTNVIAENITGTNYTHEGLTASTTYNYTVTATNEIGTSEASNTATATTWDPAPEAAPANLQATSVTHNSVTLTWDAVDGATYYEIYKDGSYLSYTNTTTYTVTALSAETSYSFTVKAGNNSGISPESEALSVTTEQFKGRTITFELKDSYGDGWNGGSLKVEFSDGESESLTIGSGNTYTRSIDVPYCTTVTVTYTAGSYPYENSFIIKDGDTEIYRSGGYNVAPSTTPYSFDVRRPAPQNLVLTEGSSDKIYSYDKTTIQWNVCEGAQSYNIYVNDEFKVNTEETTYELSELPHNTTDNGNAITVTAVVDECESFHSIPVYVKVAGTFPLTIKVQDMNGNAVANASLTINGYDEYQVYRTFEGTTDVVNGEWYKADMPLLYEYYSYNINVSAEPFEDGYSYFNESDTQNGVAFTKTIEMELPTIEVRTEKESYEANEDIVLFWNAVDSEYLEGYNVYVNEEENPRNTELLTSAIYTLEGGLAETGYISVTAVYEGYGESAKGNDYVNINKYEYVILSGTVTDGTDPIVGAEVVVKGRDMKYVEQRYTTLTNAEGAFELEVLPSYEYDDNVCYSVSVSKYGYSSYKSTEKYKAVVGSDIVLGAIVLTANADVTFVVEAREGEGNVTVEWTAPEGAIQYNVFRKDATEEVVKLATSSETNYTDESWATLENGNYTYGVSAFVESGFGEVINESFEDGIPEGWNTENGNWTVYNWGGYSDSYSMYSYYGASGNEYYAVLPPLNPANSSLSFYYLNEAYDWGYPILYDELYVYWSTSSTGPWENQLFYSQSSSSWTYSGDIDLSTIEEDVIYIAFCNKTHGANSVYIDDIVITGPLSTESSINWATAIEKDDANVFTGAGGTDEWTSASNWSNGLPANGANVFIEGDVTIASNVNVNNMTINGGSVTINNGASLTVEGTLVNEDAANLVINDGAQIFQNNEEIPATFVMNIINWTDNENAWQFIASPLLDASLFSHATGNYDLFKYDGGEDLEWYNHKLHAAEFGSTFEQGVGYLASHETAKTIVMTGTLNNKNTHTWNSYSFTYDYEGDKDVANFNLLGNPFTFNMKWSEVNASEDDFVLGYAYLNKDGGYETAVNGEIAVGDAFFVKAKSADAQMSYGEELRGAKAEQSEYINLIASGKAGRDNVIINLAGKQEGFTKMQNFNESIATVYVTEDNTRYGIYNCNSDIEEVVVSFNAKDMGDYTIAAVAEGGFSSVVLVDLFTGIETDLLTSGYTFAAKSGDNAERFVVRFSYSQESAMDSNFVYQSGEDLIIMAEGALQIVDMLGRVVYYSEVATDVTRVNVSNFDNAAYIVRVVNGEGVKTQKVVIY